MKLLRSTVRGMIQRSNAVKQKSEYQQACDLTLGRDLCLELIHEDNDDQFFIGQGVLEGVARRWARDIPIFLEQYTASYSA